jgi:hypothetical protein
MTDARCRNLGNQSAAWLDWQHDGISANALDLGDLGTVLVASAPYGAPLQSPDFTTDAELAVVHLDSRGKTGAWLAVRGTHVAVRGKQLWRSRRKANRLHQ